MKFVVEDGEQKYDLPLREGVIVIGRDASCDVTIPVGSISRRHVSCTVSGGQVVVKDLQSRNGTMLRGQRIGEATLEDGDVMRMGDLQLTFCAESADAPAQAVSLGSAPPVAGEPAPASPLPPREGVEHDEEPTPVDATFVPQDAASKQAQLVAKGDKWFVQHTGSGQEVEVVPVMQSDAVSHPVVDAQLPAPIPKHKKRGLSPLMLGAIGIGGVILLMVVLVVAKGKGKKPPPPRRMTTSEYDAEVEKALKHLESGDVNQAAPLLERAHQHYPARKFAKILLDLSSIWEDLQSDFSAVSEEAESYLDELEDSRLATPKVRAFAEKKRLWIRTEQRAEAAVHRALKLLERGEDEKALEKFNEVAKDTLIWKKHQTKVEELQNQIGDKYLRAANDASERKKWTEAITNFRKAKQFSGSLASLVDERVKECETNQKNDALMKDIRDLVGAGEFDRAKALAARMPRTPDYQRQLEQVEQRIEVGRKLFQATGAYNSGEGDKALGILQGVASGAAQTLATKIRSVMDNLKKGLKAIEEERFREGAEILKAVESLENNNANSYRQQAVSALATWQHKARTIAGQLVSQGEQAERQRKFEEARKQYEAAKQMDPDGQAGNSKIRHLIEKARFQYNKALQYQRTDPPKALKIFEEAKSMLQPGDNHYDDVCQKIQELRD